MKVVINQSNYLPWKGYFDLIHDAEVVIFLDDVQFTKNDWRNRNRFNGPNGPFWVTIPVGPDHHRRVCDVPLPTGSWREKHWRSLQQSYGRTPHFPAVGEFMRSVYARTDWGSLSAFNQEVIKSIARDFLGLTTRFLDAADLGVRGRNEDRVLDLLKAVGATTYISGPAARAYLNESRFADAEIRLVWKDYAGYPTYAQPHPQFAHDVSVLELLCCTGPAAPHYIWGWRSTAAVT